MEIKNNIRYGKQDLEDLITLVVDDVRNEIKAYSTLEDFYESKKKSF